MGSPHKLIFSSFLAIIFSFNSAKAQEFAAIPLPNDTQVIKIQFSEPIEIKNFSEEKKQSEEAKKINSTLSKNFGPLQLGLKVNPFQAQGSSIKFDLDLLDTYAILSRSEKLSDVKDGFKPNKDEHFVNPELKNEIMNFLTRLPRGSEQSLNKSRQP